MAVVSDTHGAPHPRTLELLTAQNPDVLLHAGDIGELRILDEFAKVCPVLAVRGNVDVRLAGLADVLIVEVVAKDRLLLRIVMLHIGLYGPKLRPEVARLARTVAASLVVCGHSHVPFMGSERGITAYNPGSSGPKRYGLPVVFGTVDVSATGLRLRHIDCETGQVWQPPGGPSPDTKDRIA
jgi:uncharacterized protein